jgi:acyl-CoA hydrolase
MPIGTTDYLIALNVSALIKDGGTLQLGIGELGDAIVYGLKLRHEQPSEFSALIDASGANSAHAALIAEQGGKTPFVRGLYGCTEMFVDGFIDLYRAGILKRRVYPHALLQRLLDAARISEIVDAATLDALAAAGLDRLAQSDFHELQLAGVFRDDARYVTGNIVTADGKIVSTHLANPDERRELARCCLGTRLRNGALLHGGFFFGPKAFYAALRAMPDDERRQFVMQRISFVNELYGVDQALKVAQRCHARFVNTTMMVTGLGAAVSDGLADGRVVSGIGGQYNFVAMAHALPDARSILCVRSTRTSQGRTESNIVWNYGHTSIPRHLRDIVVTEYGIADLRGRTDSEVVIALIQIMDRRFQDDFVAHAKRSGKLDPAYTVPDAARRNTPQHLESLLQPYRQRGRFTALPFGSDFTADEIMIAKALKQLLVATATRAGRMRTLIRALFVGAPNANIERLLSRLQLANATSISQRIERRVVTYALRQVMALP